MQEKDEGAASQSTGGAPGASSGAGPSTESLAAAAAEAAPPAPRWRRAKGRTSVTGSVADTHV